MSIRKKVIIFAVSLSLISSLVAVFGIFLGKKFVDNKENTTENSSVKDEDNDNEDEDEDSDKEDGNDEQINDNRPDDNDLYAVLREKAVSDDRKSLYVTSSSGIDFRFPANEYNGKGLYQYSLTSNLAKPILYFRGNIDNNNVIFANFCWKIIRTTENGGIKVLYNGPVSNGRCPGNSYSIGKSAFNVGGSGQLYLGGYMYGETYTDLEYLIDGDSLLSYYEKGADSTNFVYGSDVVYENGVYKLQNKFVSTNGYFADSKTEIENKRHYTCFSTSDTCSSVYYLRGFRTYSPYVVKLENGKKIEDILNSSVLNVSNEKNSAVKEYIDVWFENYMVDYSKYLEDVIWCNDRSVSSYGEYEYNPKFSSFQFSYFDRKTDSEIDLNCPNKNDSFTVSNEKGNMKLKYPVGLLTADEVKLAGIVGSSAPLEGEEEPKNYLYTDNSWWTMTPEWQSYDRIFMITAGSIYNDYDESDNVNAVRPAIVLKNGISITGGIGTVDSPYIIAE